jgi:hypothetical protein
LRALVDRLRHGLFAHARTDGKVTDLVAPRRDEREHLRIPGSDIVEACGGERRLDPRGVLAVQQAQKEGRSGVGSPVSPGPF